MAKYNEKNVLAAKHKSVGSFQKALALEEKEFIIGEFKSAGIKSE
tara:strand:+ start:223 stop:357 length:135 start_codon:yes stop_codon:yes gene_type:complete